jgi:hypothetical protein
MMKKFINLTMIVLVMSSIVLANDGENYSKDHWKTFTKNLVVGLKSDNHGVQQASMVLIIRYKDKLDLNKTVFPLIDIYRKDPNERMRQLATVALFYTQNKWAENYLRENFKKEKNAQIKHLIVSYIQAESETSRYAVLKEKTDLLLANNNQ